MDKPPSIPVRQLATALGRTKQSLYPLIDRGCPTHSVEAAREWIAANVAEHGPPTLGERAAGKPKPRHRNLIDQERISRIRKNKASARAQEIENKQALGLLVDREDVIREVCVAFALIRGQIEDIPDALLMEIPGDLRAQLSDRLEHRVNLILRKMAGTIVAPLDETVREIVLAYARKLEGKQ